MFQCSSFIYLFISLKTHLPIFQKLINVYGLHPEHWTQYRKDTYIHIYIYIYTHISKQGRSQGGGERGHLPP